LDAAAAALSQGRVVAIPTDTVYGLAVDPAHPGAAEALFLLKGRPRHVDLPVLVADREQALGLAIAVPAVALALMTRFWPGPLTIVLPRRPDLLLDLGEDEATIGVRCPAHPVPLALCAMAGPLATTSANRHGEPTLTSALAVVEVFGEDVPVTLDGGHCAGDPSTVVDCTGRQARILREGRIPSADVLVI